MTAPTVRIINSTYAYHPADDTTPDLTMPISAVAHYKVERAPHTRAIDPSLEFDISANGVLFPLRIHTNGLFGLLSDGNHRLRIAEKLGIKELPVQVLPDNLARKQSKVGFPTLEPVLKEYVEDWLWVHADHQLTRTIAVVGTSGGIMPNQYVKVKCECGAYWREYC
jgi:hypothetical protein